VKTKLKRTLLIAAALLGGFGCEGGESGAAVTYTYGPTGPFGVPAQTCQVVLGPIAVGNGWMHYEIDDLGAGADAIEAVIISDSYFSTEECGFTTDQAILDVSFPGSSSGDVRRSLRPPVLADTYDFVITCGNADADCFFNLTWNATY
jgi:hypothetical protein